MRRCLRFSRKGLPVFMAAVLMTFSAVGDSQAVPFTEAWEGTQSFGALTSHEFGFDFVSSIHNTTTSVLTLNSDISGVSGPYSSATVNVTFDDVDTASETAGIQLYLQQISGFAPFAFITAADLQGGYLFSQDLSPQQLADFANVGWTTIRVRQQTGTFDVTRVAMTVDGPAPVPEPATMLLLGTGLVGLAGFRKKFKK